MNVTEIIAFASSLVAILGLPIALSLYLGNKIDSLSNSIKEESRDFHARLSVIESKRRKG
jgi:hypothetical protein